MGCEAIPEQKLLTSNVEELINQFLSDPERMELAFDPDLAKTDRALIHVLAQKHNLGHKSTGKGKERFITVSKRARGASGARIGEAEIEAQFYRAHEMGYSTQNRGMGLGFGGGSYSAAPPPKSLLKQCQEQAKQIQQPQKPSFQHPNPQLLQKTAAAATAVPAALPAAPAGASPGAVAQWVSSLLGATSQFSPSDHSARQLLGEPDAFPEHGSSTRAWSAVPRPGHRCVGPPLRQPSPLPFPTTGPLVVRADTCAPLPRVRRARAPPPPLICCSIEWVRVGFKKAVHPSKVHIAETSNPGSVVCIRGTSHPKGAQAEASDWFVMWAGEAEWPDDGNARMFSPQLLPECTTRLVSAIEVSLDTTMWTTEWWGEIDAIRLDGTPPKQHGAAGGGGSGGGTTGGVVEKCDTWLDRMLWETDRAFYARARFEKERFGSMPPASVEEGMRRAAISMVHQNMTDMGCVYPKAVEAEVHVAVGQKLGNRSGGLTSGMAMEGELRAAAMGVAIS